MEEKLISFETAKLAKEKGYTYAYEFYDLEGNLNDFGMVGGWTNCHDKNYAAPTQSFLQRWLREKHNIHISIIFDENTVNTYYFYKINSGDGFIKKESMHTFKTYEEALEIGLLTALELIKKF